MAFSEIELKRIDRVVGGFCRGRVPASFHNELRLEYTVSGHSVLVEEVRPHWREPGVFTRGGVAKFRFVRTAGEWQLFWQRASLKWQAYEPLAASRELGKLVREVDRDPYGCFFG